MRVFCAIVLCAFLAACSGGGSDAPTVSDVEGVHALIEDAGFSCVDFERGEADTNAMETGQCTIDGVNVSVSTYRDNGAIDGVFQTIETLGGCEGGRSVVGNKWAIYPQSNDLADELADAIDGAETRSC